MSVEQIKPGYKRTEVGVIPEDWASSTIGEVCSFSGGSQPPRYTFKFTPSADYIRLIQIRDYKSDSFETYIPESLAQKRCTASDIMIGRYGPPVFQILRGIEGAYNVALIKVIPSSRIDREYLFYVLRQEKLFQLIDALSRRSSGQTGVDMPALKEFGLPLPSIPEQISIATALSDVDALLAKLDQLIAKKRDLKQATMQQLLTGQTRLPGFSGNWEAKRLGEISRIKTGSRNNEDKVEGGEYPFFVRSENVERINSYSHDCEAILVPGEGRIGDIFHYINGRFDVHQRVYAITQFTPGVSAKYVHLYMAMNFGAWAMQNTVKATVDSLRLPTFQTFEMRIPPTEQEQTAIATMLSDMDDELATLEVRRDKTLEIKQGMMQELLTGSIRLI